MVNFMKILHVAHFFYPCLSAGGVVNASYQIASKQSEDNDVKVISSDSCKERLKFPNGRYDVDVDGIKVELKWIISEISLMDLSLKPC